jgi:hypothetical protein
MEEVQSLLLSARVGCGAPGWLVACGDGHGRYLELVEVIYGRLM